MRAVGGEKARHANKPAAERPRTYSAPGPSIYQKATTQKAGSMDKEKDKEVRREDLLVSLLR